MKKGPQGQVASRPLVPGTMHNVVNKFLFLLHWFVCSKVVLPAETFCVLLLWDTAASVFWGGSAPLTSAGLCWGSFMSLWRPVLLCLLWCAGAADWEEQMPTDSTGWSGRPVMLWGRSWTLWQQCQTGRWCGWYCSMALTLSTTLWSNRGAPSVRDSLLLNAPLSTTGSHSCLWPLNCTTPPSDDRTQKAIYKNNTKQTIITHCHFIYNIITISLYTVYISRLSTLLFYHFLYLIVYINILFWFIFIL